MSNEALKRFHSPIGRCLQQGLRALIQGYRYAISPIFRPNCRFHPSCSAYALEALDKYGTVRGLRLSLKRVLRCHPFHPGGYDPVP